MPYPYSFVKGAAVATLPADASVLLPLVARGRRDAFATLYDLTSGRVHGLAKRMVRCNALAEDITQDVFLEVWRRANCFDPAMGSGIGWMLMLAHSRAVDRVRRTQLGRTRDGDYLRNSYSPDIDDVSERVFRESDRRRVQRALTELTSVHREAIALVYFHGHSHAEASRLIDVPLGTLKSRVREALLALSRGPLSDGS